MTKKSSKSVRVRFAPSPTGFFHIGSARSALFNYLFTRQNNGKFVLRIEDTDIQRSKAEYEGNILQGMRWLGLEYDEGPTPDSQENIQESRDKDREEDSGDTKEGGEDPKSSKLKANSFSNRYISEFGPYRQSERGHIYKDYVQKLLDQNQAYYCFSTPEELEEMRQAALSQGQTPIYNGRYRNYPKEEALARIKAGEQYVVRFKMPETKNTVNDLVRGKVEFDAKTIGDFVIAKQGLHPLFLLTNVIDDELMKISHVIRGEDHLSNTPKQIALQEALGFKTPAYAHIPIILNPDRSKMSKRFGATTIEEYRKLGYLPEAMFNFLALLGWHPKDNIDSTENANSEIMSREEIIRDFDLSRVQKGGAIFNNQKLDWLNAHYIKEKPNEELYKLIKELYLDERLELSTMQGIQSLKDEQWLKIIEISKERMRKLSEFLEMNDFFIKLENYPAEVLRWKGSGVEKTQESLEKSRSLIEGVSEKDFTKENLESAIMPTADEYGRGDLLWPLRVSLSGKDKSPGPFEIMDVLGKHETLLRIDTALAKLAEA